MSDFNTYQSEEPFIPEGLEYREAYWEDALIKLKEYERSTGKYSEHEPFVPEGLEYQDAYWQDALNKLQIAERSLARRRMWIRLSVAASILMLIGSVCYYLQSKEGNEVVTAATWVDGKSDSKAIDAKPQEENRSALQSEHNTGAALNSGVSQHGVTNRDHLVSNSAHVEHIPDSQSNHLGATHSTKSKGFTSSLPVQLHDVNQVVQVVNADSASWNGTFAYTPSQNETQSDNDAVKQPNEGLKQQREEDLTKEPQQSGSSVANHVVDEIAMKKGSFDHLPSLQDVRPLIAEKRWPVAPWNIRLDFGSILYNQFGATNRGKGFDVNAALMVDRNLTRRYAIATGLEYFQISGYHVPYSQTSVRYDFGANKTTVTVDTRRLYYVSIPVEFKYRLLNRHQLMLGAGVSYLITGANELTTTTQKNQEAQQLLSKESAMGYVRGFNSVTAFLQGGYQFWINPRTSLGLRYCQGLSDVTKNDYFKNQIANRNNRLVVELKYCLR